MRQLIYALLASLPLLTACQSAQQLNEPSHQDERIQGTISQDAGHWYVQPCSTKNRLQLSFANAQIEETFNSFARQQGMPAFVDLRGDLNNLTLEQATHITINSFYRIQLEGHACDDPDFAKLILRVHGNEPFWTLLLGSDGLLLAQPGQQPLALPYIEEQLPDGFTYISSQADQEQLQLWLSPQHCTDSMSGAFNHLSAMLDWNGHIFNGCGHYGAKRE